MKPSSHAFEPSLAELLDSGELALVREPLRAWLKLNAQAIGRGWARSGA